MPGKPIDLTLSDNGWTDWIAAFPSVPDRPSLGEAMRFSQTVGDHLATIPNSDALGASERRDVGFWLEAYLGRLRDAAKNEINLGITSTFLSMGSATVIAVAADFALTWGTISVIGYAYGSLRAWNVRRTVSKIDSIQREIKRIIGSL